MKFVFKLTMANILKNKLRTFMIIFSILLSTCLFYAIISMNSTVGGLFEKQMVKETGTAEIFVSNAANPMKGINERFEDSGLLEYSKPAIQIYGFTNPDGKEEIRTDIHGYTLADLKTVHGITADQTDNSPFEGAKAIIGARTAKDYGLKTGDQLTLSINEKDYKVTIWGIAGDENNILSLETGRMNVVLPISYLQDEFGLKDAATVYMLKTDDTTTVDDAKDYLEKTYPDYKVTVLDMDFAKSMVNMLTTVLLVLVLVVVIISAFIIYSAFKVIAIERLPVIGTLRSIGSTKASTNRILLSESLIYGIIGGILGSLLGVVTICLVKIGMQGGNAVDTGMDFNIVNMLIAAAGAVVLSVASALKPISKTLGISIKDVITNTIHNTENFKIRKPIIGVLMIGLSFALFELSPKAVALPLTFAGIIMLTVGVTFIIPLLIILFCKIFDFVEKLLPSSVGKLANSNILHDKTLHNNIVLMSIGLAVILVTNTLIYTIMIEVLNVYEKAHYDIMVQKSENSDFDAELGEMAGISSIYKNYQKMNIKVQNRDFSIPFINSFDSEYIEKGWPVELGKNKDQSLKDLSAGRGIIVTATMANKNDLKIGDKLDLETENGLQTYTVCGIAQTLIQNGQIAFISPESFQKDMGKGYSAVYFINTTASPVEVRKNIQERFSSEDFFIQTLDEAKETNIKNNNSIFVMMKTISVIAMLIGIIGIFNNYVISYLSRRRNLSVLRSIGLENGKMVRMLLLESLLCGIMGSVIGVAAGLLFMQSTKYVFVLVNMPALIHYSTTEIIITLVSGIAISLLAAIAPVVKINKMSIVQNLKYE